MPKPNRNRTLTRAVRLVAIRDMLEQGPVCPTLLAERFGVALKTVQFDLLLLQGEPFYLRLERGIFFYRKSPETSLEK